MGRIYRSVEVEYGDRKATTDAIIDTGADETVISERLAGKVNSDLYGVFKEICVPDTILEGKYADVMIRDCGAGFHRQLDYVTFSRVHQFLSFLLI